jgi:integrase
VWLPFSPGTIRHYLNALSGLYRRAEAERVVAPGFNPVAGMIGKPRGTDEEARFLSVPAAALLLEAARTYKPKRSDMVSVPHIFEILATFLLTGGRKNEVLGLAPGDVSFERGVITIRPHPWRSLKTRGSRRTVPLWPQLREILEPFMDPASRPPGQLLFPSRRGKGMIHDLRRPLEAIAKRAGLDPGEIHIHAFRHTYAAARLQTLDHGAPVSPFTVARELGHISTALIERIYGHVSGTRHRAEVVEYRAHQHAELDGRLRALRAKVAAEV